LGEAQHADQKRG